MKSVKKILLLLLLCALAVTSLAACGGDGYSFGKYSYTNPPKAEGDWRDLSYGDDMTIDGKLDEDMWASLTPTRFTRSGVTMTTRIYLGETGIFMAMENDDAYVFYNNNRPIHNNSSMELYLSAENGKLEKTSVQLRFGASGYNEQYVAVKRGNEHWSRQYVPVMSRVWVDGALNTADNKGYTIEAFMPYTAMDYTEKPDHIYALAAFNRIASADDSSNRLGWYNQPGEVINPSTYARYEQNGYAGGENTTLPMGDHMGFYATGNWDFSLATGDDPVLFTSGGGEQRMYFNQIYGQKYIVSAYIERSRAINDANPKAGILAAESRDGQTAALFDVKELFTKDLFAVSRPKGGDWNWPGQPGGQQEYNGGINYGADQELAKLTVARFGTSFYFFVNDTLMLKKDIPLYENTDTVAGLITMGCEAYFKGFYTSQDEQEVAALIASVDHTDETNHWKLFGDFDVVSSDSIKFRAKSANVGGNGNQENGARYILKTGATLSGDFELSYTINDFRYSADQPNWMKPYLSARLYRTADASGANDAFMLHTKDKAIQTSIDGQWNTTDVLAGNPDFSKEHTITILRKVTDKTAKLLVYFDGTLLKEFNSNYVGDYAAYGFSSNFIAAEITKIHGGAKKGYPVRLTIGENGTASAPATAHFESDFVVTVTPNADYTVDTFTVNGKDAYNLLREGKATLRMGYGMNIQVTFKQIESRTVSGKIILDKNLGTMSQVTASLNDGKTNFPLTLGSDGAFSLTLKDGSYTLSVTHPHALAQNISQIVRVQEGMAALNVNLSAKDPTLDGALDDTKKFYYSDARKINTPGGDFYAYFGTDALYLMMDVRDTTIANTSGVLEENDFIDIYLTMDQPNTDGKFTAGRVYRMGIARNPNALLTMVSIDGSNMLLDFDRFGQVQRVIKEVSSGYRVEVRLSYKDYFKVDTMPESIAMGMAFTNVGGAFDFPSGLNWFDTRTYLRYNSDGLMQPIEPKDLTLDGDLSDWDTAMPSFEFVSDATEGTGYTYRAFKGSDGVYVSVTANYQELISGKPDWTCNTGVELVFADVPHFLRAGMAMYLTADGNGVAQYIPGIQRTILAAAQTTDRGSAEEGVPRFTTTFELFVPYDLLQSTRASLGDRLGIVFNTGSNGGRVFWCENAYNPYMGEQNSYYVYETGLATTAKA